MLENFPVLSLILLLPVVGAFVVLLLPNDRGNWQRATALVFTLIPLALSLVLFAQYNASRAEAYTERYTWLSIPLNKELLQGASLHVNFDHHLAVDGISLPLLVLSAVVCAMALLASVHIHKRWKTYYFLFLILEAGIYGFFMTRDLIEFFIFFELTLIPMFFLIGIWGYEGREKAAVKFLVYNGFGSAAMLLGLLILVATAGFTADIAAESARFQYSGSYDVIFRNLTDPESAASNASLGAAVGVAAVSDTLKWASFVLLLVAFGVKIPIFPLHTWMLRVHTEAPPSIVMIHSGVLLKMGVYGLIRFGGFLLPAQLESWAGVIATLGVINILYGAVLACVQKEFKLVLAYSSVSHMGVVLLGIASLNEAGLQGALFQSVSHGLISALMFLIVGNLYERTKTTMLDELGGLAKSVPFMSGILLTAGLASLGLPGLSGFVGEFMSFLGLFASMKWLTALGVLGILFAAVYVLRSVLSITFGPTPERWAGMKDARFIEAVPMVTLTALIVLLGVYPSILTEIMQGGFSGLLEQIQLRTGG